MNTSSAAVRLSASTVDSGVRYAFARHETFHPRFGWLKKGFEAVVRDPEIFLREDAHLQLGVGKNMAVAIRYWCSAFKLISAAPDEKSRHQATTEFAERLLAENGWDPYLEQTASLWLLHWKLLKSPCLATGWRFAFYEFRQAEFTTDDLMKELAAYRDGLGIRVTDSSLQKDVSCLLRMYVEQAERKQITEETLDCPFVELGLIRATTDARHYHFQSGAKANLPAAVIVAAALEYAAAVAHGQRTISLSSLSYGDGSPGLAFKLTETALCNALEEISRKGGSVNLTDAAGLVQMSFKDEPEKLALKILGQYYAR